MSFNLYDETANSLFKRITNKAAAFQWGMLDDSGGLRECSFSFDEVVGLTTHSRNMQELRLDLLLSFSQNVKTSPALVIHVSTNNSLSSTLRQTGEESNLRIAQMNAHGRLKCVTVGSTLQLYALLDMLQYSLHVAPSSSSSGSDSSGSGSGSGCRSNPASAPAATLLILDNLEPLLLAQAQAQAQALGAAAACSGSGSGSGSGSISAADVATKLGELVETQTVLAVWISEAGTGPPSSGSAAAAAEPAAMAMAAPAARKGQAGGTVAGRAELGQGQRRGMGLKRSLHYYPRLDCL